MTLRIAILGVIAGCLAGHALSQDVPSLRTVVGDPFQLCQSLDAAVPPTLSGARAMGRLLSERVSSCTDYSSEPPPGCTAHHLTFPGLLVTVLKDGRRVRPVEVQVSDGTWKILEPVRVGITLQAVAKQFGIRQIPSTSPVELRGDCTPLVLWHTGGRISKASLSCHACD
jgi:hypothetical protein